MKTLKEAVLLFLADLRANRSLELSYKDAVEGLNEYKMARLNSVYTVGDQVKTVEGLEMMVSGLLEYKVTLRRDNATDVSTIYYDESEAIACFRKYVFSGKKVTLSVD